MGVWRGSQENEFLGKLIRSNRLFLVKWNMEKQYFQTEPKFLILHTTTYKGTNGYIQANKFFVRRKANKVVTNSSKGFQSGQGTVGDTKKANKEILEHEHKRKMELKLLVLEEKLMDQGYTDAEITEKLDEARTNLEAALAK